MNGSIRPRLALLLAGAAFFPLSTQAQQVAVANGAVTEDVLVTARLRPEKAQDVPVALSVIDTHSIDATGSYNIAQLTQLVPALSFISSNPRNTNFTIRGLGSSFGLANDGLEPGAGLYIDQVYFARPAAATFDLLDIDQVAVLRGPQGTLYGKNTTAGAINITTRAPSFTPEAQAEISIGDLGYVQGKASVSGVLAGNVLAGRLSISTTQRNGTITNVTTGAKENDQNSLAARAQLLYRASETFDVRLSGDYSRQVLECCAQVYVTAGTTLKPTAQRYTALAAAAGYVPPSLNPYDRLTDVNSEIRANQKLAGVSVIANWNFGEATLTSITAWRYWSWNPANDRDYTRLSILTQSANPDQQNQYSQEFRIASSGERTIDYLFGIYAFRQTIDAQPVAQYGAQATRWLIPSDLTIPVNLLDGYRSDAVAKSTTRSYAVFGQWTWHIDSRLSFTPGLRYTYEKKHGAYDLVTSGGLMPANTNEDTRKKSIVRDQHYTADVTDGSLSGQVNLAYKFADEILGYVSYAKGHKSGGINMAGLPTDSAGNPLLVTAAIKPENNTTYEAGLKSQIFDRVLTANLAVFYTDVRDYQANVVDSGPGALRGYLANVDKVRVEGVEFDLALAPEGGFSAYANGTYTDGQYVSFMNGPCPLELIGTSTAACDLSGKPLPGLSRWALSVGGEYDFDPLIGGLDGMAFLGADSSLRSSFFSDASDSKYTRVGGYGLFNLRAGFRASANWEAFVWAKNVLDKNYLQFVSVQSGNSGLVIGTPGDPRTFGITLRATY